MQQVLSWARPVQLGLGDGAARLIYGPADALRSLREWPAGGGWFFERAINRCHAALETEGDLELSRQSFVAASLEASIPFV